MQITRNKLSSTLPPTFIFPADSILNGQKGLIPSIDKLSANKCPAYPKKKGSAKTGAKKANPRVIKTHKVKLCINPLCLKKNCKGLKIILCPKYE